MGNILNQGSFSTQQIATQQMESNKLTVIIIFKHLYKYTKASFSPPLTINMAVL
uniref:Uncharacterized protein n=1 Tax=Anguilla anguilla TaxID=7936 RepID=A0A0E9WGR5_ANGAN